MSFMLDETASRITRQDVINLSPPKVLGSRHNPLPHKDLIDLMEAGLVKNNFKINDLELGLTHDGNRIFGLFDVEAPSSEIMLKKHNSNYEVGFRGSYDQSLASSAVFGRGCFPYPPKYLTPAPGQYEFGEKGVRESFQHPALAPGFSTPPPHVECIDR